MYEWDEGKRQVNLAKHGVDFADMDAFEWDTAALDVEEDPAEPRWIAIGFIGVVLYFVVFTERGDNIRIISLRKATRREARNYVENQA
ncbi:MAG: BrnT family toxin [Gemmatimonadetes bacterium]|nr:BrnT family toxin [Gemmatimonadota bacterium]